MIARYALPELPLAPFQNALLPKSIENDRKFHLGSVGSDLWHGDGDAADEFWMISDRGPNGSIDMGSVHKRIFAVPGFDPVILHVKLHDEKIEILRAIPIVGKSGKPVSGLSNLRGHDEDPHDAGGSVTDEFDVDGLDTEGFVRVHDGTFWAVEEYAPSIVHISADGVVLARFVPERLHYAGNDYPVIAKLPAILARRAHNRGFEGAALTPDGKILWAIVQSALANPDDKAAKKSLATRLIAFDIAAEKCVEERVWRFHSPAEIGAKSPGDVKCSAMCMLDATHAIVEERTDENTRLFVADLASGENVLGTRWDDVKTEPTLEQIGQGTGAAGPKTIESVLLVDLSHLEGVPPKIEGVAIVDATTLALSNDEDFNFGELDAEGNNHGGEQKTWVVFVRLAKALR